MSGIKCCASFQDRDRFVSLCLRLFSWRQYVAQQGGFVCNTMVLGLSFVAIASHAQAPVPDSWNSSVYVGDSSADTPLTTNFTVSQ